MKELEEIFSNFRLCVPFNRRRWDTADGSHKRPPGWVFSKHRTEENYDRNYDELKILLKI
jgi:hypothetical protein